MGGEVTFVTRNGQRVTAWMAYQIDRLSVAFFARFGLVLLVMSAIRTYQEQVDIFLSRYVTAGNINGRKVYDTRVWRGTRYYRISPLGTVAVPGTSNHEIQGTSAAVDFGDSGRDAGVAVAGTVRANWLRANAPAYDFVPEGYAFQEPWHYKALNIFKTPPGGSGGGGTSPSPVPTKEGLEMAEAIIVAPNDVVVHLRGGGKTNFGTVAEYNSLRDEIASLRKLKATDLMPLPALKDVPRIPTWDRFRALCNYFGAPVD